MPGRTRCPGCRLGNGVIETSLAGMGESHKYVHVGSYNWPLSRLLDGRFAFEIAKCRQELVYSIQSPIPPDRGVEEAVADILGQEHLGSVADLFGSGHELLAPFEQRIFRAKQDQRRRRVFGQVQRGNDLPCGPVP